MFAHYLAKKYPESYDPSIPDHLVYSGNLKLTETIEELGVDAGKLVLSPTRTYAPIISLILKELRANIHGMVHCSGGAQTKVLHFLRDGLRAVKNNLFPTPLLFQLIQEQSQTDWKEMYRVFNMGHRMELYLPEANAQQVIDISRSFNVDAQIVGYVEKSNRKELLIKSEQGQFSYI
jgi:phosphoribosylformylglycinamidine cyclo-ligase